MAKKRENVHSPSMVKFFFMGVVVLGVVAGFTYYFLTSVLTNSKASNPVQQTQKQCFQTHCRVGNILCPSRLVRGVYVPLNTASQFCLKCYLKCYEKGLDENYNRPNTTPFIPPPRN